MARSPNRDTDISTPSRQPAPSKQGKTQLAFAGSPPPNNKRRSTQAEQQIPSPPSPRSSHPPRSRITHPASPSGEYRRSTYRLLSRPSRSSDISGSVGASWDSKGGWRWVFPQPVSGERRFGLSAVVVKNTKAIYRYYEYSVCFQKMRILSAIPIMKSPCRARSETGPPANSSRLYALYGAAVCDIREFRTIST